LESIGYDLKKEVGIITPYKDQERELINRFGYRLGQNNFSKESKIGTVHKFQGVEYKVIIFSMVISREQDTLSFINIDPSMINVAVSRSKEVFMVVGDYEKVTKESSYNNYAGRMSKYIELNGKLVGFEKQK
jgi:superfamily I DNA and/or RNA helicase